MSSMCDERPPGSAVALDQDLARGDGIAHEVVDDEVAAKSRRDAVGGGISQVRRAEVVVGELTHVLLGQHLRLAVRRHRVERGLLVEEFFPGLSVEAARRREDEPRDAGLLRPLGEARRCAVVDVECRVGRQVADRIVGNRGEVKHGFEPLQCRPPSRPGRRCGEPARRRRRRRMCSPRRDSCPGRPRRGPPAAASAPEPSRCTRCVRLPAPSSVCLPLS